MRIFDRIKIKQNREAKRKAKQEARNRISEVRQARIKARLERYKEGGIIIPNKMRYNRRLLLLVRLRRK